MKTVYHPESGHALDVPDADIEAWVEQGWRKTQPKDTKTSAATAAGTEGR